jgi:hypothetical protein
MTEGLGPLVQWSKPLMSPSPVPPPASLRRRLHLGAAGVAILYGLGARLFFGTRGSLGGAKPGAEALFTVMSLGFIFVVPFVIGFLGAYLSRQERLGGALAFGILPALTALGLALVLAFEGLICVFLWVPLYTVLSALGGLAAFGVRKVLGDRRRPGILGLVATLPLGVGLGEHALPRGDEARHVETSVVVRADAASVWPEIVEVPPIQPWEHGFGWSHLVGFPRPVAARAEGRGVGSLREASFERGVVFLERVTDWEEGRLLSFTIHAEADSIPARALDEHVTVGGPYFDVLRGTYRLEQRGQETVLHLSSDHRLSTRFNGYAGLWTDFIMRDTQAYILRIVARRAEARQQRAVGGGSAR